MKPTRPLTSRPKASKSSRVSRTERGGTFTNTFPEEFESQTARPLTAAVTRVTKQSLGEITIKVNKERGLLLDRYHQALANDQRRAAAAGVHHQTKPEHKWDTLQKSISKVFDDNKQERYRGLTIKGDGKSIQESIGASEYWFVRTYIPASAVLCRIDVEVLTGRSRATMSLNTPYLLGSDNKDNSNNVKINRSLVLESKLQPWKVGYIYISVRSLSSSTVRITVTTVGKSGLRPALLAGSRSRDTLTYDDDKKPIMLRVQDYVNNPKKRQELTLKVAKIRKSHLSDSVLAAQKNSTSRDFEAINLESELRPRELKKRFKEMRDTQRDRRWAAFKRGH